MRRHGLEVRWLLIIVAALGMGAIHADTTAPPRTKTVRVDGFELTHGIVSTPREEWDDKDAVRRWLVNFRGTLKTRKPLAYRRVTLPPGTYDIWIESSDEGRCHLLIGDHTDDGAPRLRSMFRLYDQEEGVSESLVELKLVAKATKLRYSLRFGKVEGHGNLRVPSVPKSTVDSDATKSGKRPARRS